MAIGMSYQEFWYAAPFLCKTYYDAHTYKIRQRNEELWLQGLYNYNAFASVMESFSWSLGGGKGARPKGYMTQPIDISPKTEAEIKREQEKERAKAIQSLNRWLSAWKEQYGNS